MAWTPPPTVTTRWWSMDMEWQDKSKVSKGGEEIMISFQHSMSPHVQCDIEDSWNSNLCTRVSPTLDYLPMMPRRLSKHRIKLQLCPEEHETLAVYTAVCVVKRYSSTKWMLIILLIEKLTVLSVWGFWCNIPLHVFRLWMPLANHSKLAVKDPRYLNESEPAVSLTILQVLCSRYCKVEWEWHQRHSYC